MKMNYLGLQIKTSSSTLIVWLKYMYVLKRHLKSKQIKPKHYCVSKQIVWLNLLTNT